MEPTQKQERRYRRTETLILNGLTTLLQQKSIKEITVRELADLVDINRSTFYLHYTDIYDLLEQTEQRLLKQFTDAVDEKFSANLGPNESFSFWTAPLPFSPKCASLCSADGSERGHRLSPHHRKADARKRHAGAPCLYAERAARTGSAICSLLFSSGMYGTGECVAEKRLSGTADPHGRDRNAAPAGGHFGHAHLISKEIPAFYPQILNTNRRMCR